MRSNFLKLASLLGVCEQCPYFTLNENQYFYMFYVPHLLKATRNNLLKYDIGFVSKRKSFTARWKYLEKVFEKDSSFKFRSMPKLTSKHINPSNFDKMKVKYATQVLSHTVAAALYTHISSETLPQDAEGTAEFIDLFDNLFDCLNSSTFSTPVILRKPITLDSTHLTFLQEVLSVINSIQFFEPEKGQKIKFKIKCIQGWKTTINTVIQLWKKLSVGDGASKQPIFLMTRRLNQDCLENFFGYIRHRNNNCDRPTSIQFQRAFRRLFCQLYLTDSPGKNCEEDPCKILLETSLHEAREIKYDTATTSAHNPLFCNIYSFDLSLSDHSLLETNATTYVAGFLLKKCFAIYNCQECNNNLSVTSMTSLSQIQCDFKAYSLKHGELGSLVFLAKNLCNIFLIWNKCLYFILKKFIRRLG